ncbi:hypothetical protein ACOMHN_044279 [Nucella lapillus]
MAPRGTGRCPGRPLGSGQDSKFWQAAMGSCVTPAETDDLTQQTAAFNRLIPATTKRDALIVSVPLFSPPPSPNLAGRAHPQSSGRDCHKTLAYIRPRYRNIKCLRVFAGCVTPAVTDDLTQQTAAFNRLIPATTKRDALIVSVPLFSPPPSPNLAGRAHPQSSGRDCHKTLAYIRPRLHSELIRSKAQVKDKMEGNNEREKKVKRRQEENMKTVKDENCEYKEERAEEEMWDKEEVLYELKGGTGEVGS